MQTTSPSWVSFEFYEIDTDSLIKRENHAMTKWVQDGISHDELRGDLGLPAVTDLSNFYTDLIGGINNKYAMDQAAQAAAQRTAGGSPSGGPKTPFKKTHSLETVEGIRSYKELNSIFKEATAPSHIIFKYIANWETLERNFIDYCQHNDMFDINDAGLANIVFQFTTRLRIDILDSMRYGVDRGYDEARSIDPDVAPMRISVFNQKSEVLTRLAGKDFTQLLVDLVVRINKELEYSRPVEAVEAAFAALTYRLKSIVSSHIVLAENWGVAIVAEHLEYISVWQDSEVGCSICQSRWIKIKDLMPSGLAPMNTHPNCGCKVHIREE
jgi:hypothetical protein